MSKTVDLHLFQGYGIELEYMIVDRRTLEVRPITDQILTAMAGSLTNEVELGEFAWSNELVMHVIELKTNGPVVRLQGLAGKISAEIRRVNEILAAHGAMLMPTGMHPSFIPEKETHLWPHDNAVIYDTYNRIFSCSGHGWSNLQSMHINLPFSGDEEFGRLHAAIRLVLPIIPALAASSPLVEGCHGGFMDQRLEFYRVNQRSVPLVTGRVIPEGVFDIASYHKQILEEIYGALRPLDPDAIIQEEWVNSRGAIARFERNAIEIRLVDVQECPQADMAVAALIVAAVRSLVEEHWANWIEQKAWRITPLEQIFLQCVRQGGDAPIANADYLSLFKVPRAQQSSMTAMQLWQHIAEQLLDIERHDLKEHQSALGTLWRQGCLAKRILKATGPQPSPQVLTEVYHRLATCLAEGRMFEAP